MRLYVRVSRPPDTTFKEKVNQMKLNITNESITRLFTLVGKIAEVKALIKNQEIAVATCEATLEKLLGQQRDYELHVARRAQMLREGNVDGLKELMQIQWFQEDIARKISDMKLRIAGASKAISMLEDELLMYQSEVDATLEGRCEVDAQRDVSGS